MRCQPRMANQKTQQVLEIAIEDLMLLRAMAKEELWLRQCVGLRQQGLFQLRWKVQCHPC